MKEFFLSLTFFFIGGKEVRGLTLISSSAKGPCSAAWDAGICVQLEGHRLLFLAALHPQPPVGDGGINCKTVGGS